jgi:hypothetical protein
MRKSVLYNDGSSLNGLQGGLSMNKEIQERTENVQVVNALCYAENGGLLLVAKYSEPRDAFYWTFPGGKISKGESKRTALMRELNAELPGGIFSLNEHFSQKVFSGKAYFSDKLIDVHLCKVNIVDCSQMSFDRNIISICCVSPAYVREMARHGSWHDDYPITEVTREVLAYSLTKGCGKKFVL